MIDIRDALYIPGLGFSVSKTKDQSLGSAEADFAALLEEVRAARQANGGLREEPPRVELTREDIRELAARYDPANMTQEEYDAFLDDLIAKGALVKSDLSYIEYRGELVPNGEFVCVGRWDLLEDGPIRDSMASALVWSGSGPAPEVSYRPGDANALAWAKAMGLWKPAGGAGILPDAENRRNGIFRLLADTLDAMQRQR